MDSLLNLSQYDQDNHRVIWKRFPVRSGPGNIHHSRNIVVREFLRTDCEWLWFLDYDMGFDSAALYNLLDVADKETAPVVSGLYFGQRMEASDGKGGWRSRSLPIAFMWENDVGFVEIEEEDIPENVVLQVYGVGAGCLLIHRSILETIGESWFSYLNLYGLDLSEDLSFSFRVNSICQKPLFVDTRVLLTHHKDMWLTRGDK
jgi:GT2 family glycosyltransferase